MVFKCLTHSSSFSFIGRLVKMAVLKSPRNNKKKKKWVLQYHNTFKTITIPQVKSKQLRIQQQSHQTLSTTRLENHRIETLPTQVPLNRRLPFNLPFTKFESCKIRPYYRHFRVSDSTRRVSYPLLFKSIM